MSLSWDGNTPTSATLLYYIIIYLIYLLHYTYIIPALCYTTLFYPALYITQYAILYILYAIPYLISEG